VGRCWTGLAQVTAVRNSADGGSVWCVSYSDAETFIEGELAVDAQGQVGEMAGVVRQLKMGDGGFWEVRAHPHRAPPSPHFRLAPSSEMRAGKAVVSPPAVRVSLEAFVLCIRTHLLTPCGRTGVGRGDAPLLA
jgi:hypothetical protein